MKSRKEYYRRYKERKKVAKEMRTADLKVNSLKRRRRPANLDSKSRNEIKSTITSLDGTERIQSFVSSGDNIECALHQMPKQFSIRNFLGNGQ